MVAVCQSCTARQLIYACLPYPNRGADLVTPLQIWGKSCGEAEGATEQGSKVTLQYSFGDKSTEPRCRGGTARKQKHHRISE